MIGQFELDSDSVKRVMIAALCSLAGALLGSFLFPGIGTMIGDMCAAG